MAPINEKGKLRPPQLRNRLTDVDEIRTLELSPGGHPTCKISFRSDDVGGLGEYAVFDCTSEFFLCLIGLFVTRTGGTGGPIMTIYTS